MEDAPNNILCMDSVPLRPLPTADSPGEEPSDAPCLRLRTGGDGPELDAELAAARGSPDADDRGCQTEPLAAGTRLPTPHGNGHVPRDQIVEALLFASDAPLSTARLSELIGDCTPGSMERDIDALNEKYEQAGLSFRIVPIAHGYQMMTLPRFRKWLDRLNQQRATSRLSEAALETLAVVAYRQPVIRADIEAIRGVACGEVLARLRELGLVRIVGRAEVIGRPILYGTTHRFLQVFGLSDLQDLPPMEAFRIKSVTRPCEEIEPVKPPSGTASAAGSRESSPGCDPDGDGLHPRR